MRRRFAILLLVLLPLQFGWSAVMAYCVHETEVMVQQHFDHYEHESARALVELEMGSDDDPTEHCLDCGHGNCCNVASEVGSHIEVTIASGHYEAGPSTIRTTALDPPYRPQWAGFA